MIISNQKSTSLDQKWIPGRIVSGSQPVLIVKKIWDCISQIICKLNGFLGDRFAVLNIIFDVT